MKLNEEGQTRIAANSGRTSDSSQELNLILRYFYNYEG